MEKYDIITSKGQLAGTFTVDQKEKTLTFETNNPDLIAVANDIKANGIALLSAQVEGNDIIEMEDREPLAIDNYFRALFMLRDYGFDFQLRGA